MHLQWKWGSDTFKTHKTIRITFSACLNTWSSFSSEIPFPPHPPLPLLTSSSWFWSKNPLMNITYYSILPFGIFWHWKPKIEGRYEKIITDNYQNGHHNTKEPSSTHLKQGHNRSLGYAKWNCLDYVESLSISWFTWTEVAEILDCVGGCHAKSCHSSCTGPFIIYNGSSI